MHTPCKKELILNFYHVFAAHGYQRYHAGTSCVQVQERTGSRAEGRIPWMYCLVHW